MSPRYRPSNPESREQGDDWHVGPGRVAGGLGIGGIKVENVCSPQREGSAKSPLKTGASSSSPLRTLSWIPLALEGFSPIGPCVAFRPTGTGSSPGRADDCRVGRVVWPATATSEPAGRTRTPKNRTERPLHMAAVPRAGRRRTLGASVSGRNDFTGDRSARPGQRRRPAPRDVTHPTAPWCSKSSPFQRQRGDRHFARDTHWPGRRGWWG